MTSAVAGVVVLLAFLAMPVATLPFLGSISGVAVPAKRLTSACSACCSWCVPLAAVAIVGMAAALQVFGPRPRPPRADGWR